MEPHKEPCRVWLYRWSSSTRAHDMPTDAELVAEGYEWVGQHPRYPDSSLYRKPSEA